jgi:hypothetical protein
MKKIDFGKIANELVEKLNVEGFEAYIWHVAESTTGSAYIRFKNPLLCSIRLGDHNGKEKYKYKYNVRSDIQKSHTEVDRGTWRWYFKVEEIESLIAELRKRRELTKDWKQKYEYGIPSFKKQTRIE